MEKTRVTIRISDGDSGDFQEHTDQSCDTSISVLLALQSIYGCNTLSAIAKVIKQAEEYGDGWNAQDENAAQAFINSAKVYLESIKQRRIKTMSDL